ncbi:glycerophosphoryl diester phosphodiesterase [Fontibacillus phaseoli]|uniref:Glycerophosphoryl diester phosphodiesterase n=1 Tax=Fontibacillus phaseoli TaxID=1416533 RepID=A0A369BQP2_9BACL|nr:glycerophosphodiester phosphodiesterase family protein [Fontibacillus phaseoli]RCX23873.1 glycerophosphoryl diester phosphodiesterase [Fontibacillus phaseoli]
MKKLKRLFKRKRFWILAGLILFIYLNNSSLFVGERDGGPKLLAHRGLAQTFSMEGIENDTCTAERIYEPEHPYLENSIASMEAAFKAGADMVELDVKPTKDGQFAVFHDWTLECRTEAQGTTKDFTMAELKLLDIGYGYTADGGKTYPFRGKGINLMPSLPEVLKHFPDRSFLVHIKSNDAEEGVQLAQYFADLSPEKLEQYTVYGGDEPVAALKEALPDLRVMSKATLKKCLVSYEASGWTGYIPAACRNTELHIPEKIAPWIWGWPDKFLSRMDRANTRVIVVGGDGSDFSSGFDSLEDVKRLPSGYNGWIWSNRVDRIASVKQK